MKRLTDFAQPVHVIVAVFGVSAVFVGMVLVRRMSELGIDWRLGRSWNVDVSHVLVSFFALAMLLATIAEAWRKARE